MKYSIVSILALLAACGGSSNNNQPDTGTNPAPDTLPAVDTTPVTPDTLGIDTQTPDTTPITPDTGTPDTQVPDTLVPDTQKPDTLAPDTTPPADAACPVGKFGSKCNFDATQFSAWRVFCPADSGKLEIVGATGSASYLNGYYIDVPVGAVDRCSIFFLSPALGVNLPAPATGKIVPVAHGIEVVAVDKDNPLLLDGNLNKVTLLADVGVFFNNNRGAVQLFDSGSFTALATTVVQTGTLGKTKHFSPFYLNVGEPVVAASASHVGNREVVIDFSGTVHAGSTTPYLLQFAVAEGGTPLTLTSSDGTGLRFRTTLAGGSHTLSATVADQYGDVGSKQVSLTVDLCSTATCQPWQTCRATDGVCVGSDPCAPNPCVHGVCSSTTGSAVCTSCADGWTGTLCDVQDLCFGKTCSSHGTCQPTDGTCSCSTGFDPSTNCGTCAAGYTGYPNCVVDPCYGNTCSGHGTCGSGVCSCATGYAGSSCNSCAPGYTGYPTCVPDPCYGNTCNGHGTCGGGTCSCSTGFDPSTNCGSCAAGYQGYPTCTLIPPPAPTISGLGIDISGQPAPGYCVAGGFSYPLSFTATNSTACSGNAVKIAGGSGTSGSVSGCAIDGSTGSATYTTGDASGNTIRITIQVTGPGGSASTHIDVTLD